MYLEGKGILLEWTVSVWRREDTMKSLDSEKL